MNKSNYDLVLEVIKNYDMENVLNDFKDKFVEGENISREDYNEFCYNYVDDCSEGFYIDLNWKFILSGGDWDVFELENSSDDSWRNF
jgi:hypothetical protein